MTLCLLLSGLLFPAFAPLTYGATATKARLELEWARENLRISEASEARIASELERLRDSGNAPAEVLKDYEAYLERMRAIVLENRRIVREMEVTLASHSPPKAPPGPSSALETHETMESEPPGQEETDELTALDREFQESLAAFDEMLLKELQEIRARSSKKMTDLVDEAAEIAERLREKGVEIDDDSLETEAASSEEETETEPSEGVKDAEATAQGDHQDRSRGETRGETLADKEHSRADGHDDDIVARQIREAAENASDPELKEKLWKEYEDYKKGNRQ